MKGKQYVCSKGFTIVVGEHGINCASCNCTGIVPQARRKPGKKWDCLSAEEACQWVEWHGLSGVRRRKD